MEAAAAAGRRSRPSRTGLHEDVTSRSSARGARLLAGGPPEMQGFVRDYLQATLSRIAQGTADEDVRVRWLTGRSGASWSSSPGPEAAAAAGRRRRRAADRRPRRDLDRRILKLLTEGRTNPEMAELDHAEADVASGSRACTAGLGASSRAEATSLAFRGLAAVGIG